MLQQQLVPWSSGTRCHQPRCGDWQAERRSSSAQVMNGGADRRDRAVDVPSLTAAPDRDARTKRPRVPPAGGRHDWNKYDQGQVVYRPAQMSGDELRLGDVLLAALDRWPFPDTRRTSSRTMAALQHVHAKGCGYRADRSDCGPNSSGRYFSNASYYGPSNVSGVRLYLRRWQPPQEMEPFPEHPRNNG